MGTQKDKDLDEACSILVKYIRGAENCPDNVKVAVAILCGFVLQSRHYVKTIEDFMKTAHSRGVGEGEKSK